MLAGDVGFSDPRSFAVGANPEGLVAADVNGDGHQDLITANFADLSVSILEGVGDGDFLLPIDFPTNGNSIAVTTADVSGDNRLDIITANLTGNTVSVLIQQPRDGFFDFDGNYAVGTFPYSVTAADVDEDGNLDLIVPYAGLPNVPGGISVLLGDGFGRFEPSVDIADGLRPVSVAAADLNGDGHLDIAAANGFIVSGDDNNDVAILMGDGRGAFAEPVRYSAGDKPADIAIADVDMDGTPDLVAVNSLSNDVSVLLGEGGGTFAPAVNYAVGRGPNSLLVSDLNGDSYLDIAVANGDTNDVSILLNVADGNFEPRGRFFAGSKPLSIVAGNFNGDQLPDLAVATQETDEALVLYNTPAEPTAPVLLDVRGALYRQNFDADFGMDGAAAGVRLPPGWFSVHDGRAGTSITRSFPAGAISNGTYNAGRDEASDRAFAVGRTSTDQPYELQFVADVTGGTVTGVRLAFDIEAWQADTQLAANPGEAAFDVVLEADTGAGFQTVANIGRVTTGPTLRPPSGPLGTELWKTDGEDVSLVADIVPGETGSDPGSLVPFNDSLYFVAGNGVLYKLDDAGLSEVAELGTCSEFCSTHPRSWVLGDALYLDILDRNERTINDGQRIGRDMFLKISADELTRIANVEGFDRLRSTTVYNDEIFFSPEEPWPFEFGREPWAFDGETMRLVANINTRYVQNSWPDTSSKPREFAEYNGELYFAAGTMLENEVEIFKTDGSTVTQVTDILPLDAIGETWCGSCAASLTVVGDKLFFEATDDFEDARTDGFYRSLWTFDGTTVTKVHDGFLTTDSQLAFGGITAFKDEFYFVATHETLGSGLWKSDGTTAMFVEETRGSVEPVWRGWRGPPTQPIVFNDELYFAAKGRAGGFEVWKSDGTDVSRLPNPNPNGSFLMAHSSETYAFPHFAASDHELYFLANDGRTGFELWKTDGTNVVRVTDINPGPGDSFDCLFCLRDFTEFGGEIYFAATNGDGLSAIMDGDAGPNRVSFDSGVLSTDIPEGATIRLRFAAPGDRANVGYVIGLDNVQLRLLSAGDSDGNGQFDQIDVVIVLQANKYLTGEPATFADGDWNLDGMFDQLDVVAALQTNNYLQGPYAVRRGKHDPAVLAKSVNDVVDTVLQDSTTFDELLIPW